MRTNVVRTREFAEGVEFGRHMSPPRRSRSERKAAAMEWKNGAEGA